MAKNTSFLKPCLFIMHKLKENEEMKILDFISLVCARSRHCIEIDFFTPIYIAIVSGVTSFKEPAFRHICLGF